MYLVPASFWRETPRTAERLADPQLGDPLPGLTDAQLADFNDGLDQFTEVETPEQGIGPVFNGRSCAECHVHPVVGGSAFDLVVSAETRFARVGPGTFDPLASLGGPLIQRVGLGSYAGSLGPCNIPGETVPPQANAISVRITTPLFGAGLIDAIPDWQILLNAAIPYGDGISGRPNIVVDPRTGNRGVGRFGWKAQHSSLLTFSSDAYLNEMGVTNSVFPTENKPQGLDIPPGCDLHADPESTDDAQAFFNFMRLLAPPPRQAITLQVAKGSLVFVATGCASCHTPAMTTGDNAIEALRFRPVRLFSDLLLHDVGTGDGMVQGQATGREFRTAPLWGASSRDFFMHDGRARNIPDAVAAHGGEATKVRQRYNGLNASDKAAILAFLLSL
jgi:CxxC motif-containing protein (DUF1111 family)